MATLLAVATGNWTASSTWALCDSTSELDSEANNTNISTSILDSSTFTPGAITVDGVAVKVQARAASPTGTFTVTLRNSTDSSDVTSVTINVSDINANTNSGWIFLKFSASQTLTAGKAYLIRVVCSNTGSQVTLYRNATANNWSRQLRTTTTQAPASGDKLLIPGELTGAGTSNILTVTMNSTSSTSYGSTSLTQSIYISSKGVLTFGTSSSTDYILKFAGIARISGGGTLNMGTTGTPMPSTSTAKLQFDVASNVDTGLQVDAGGIWNGRGNAISFVSTKLAADASASATSLTTVDSTGWKNGDTIAIASTTRTASECESKILSSDATGTTLTIAAITNAHSGTNDVNGDIRGELGNLTRNIQILGTSSSLQGYIFIGATSIVDIQYIEFNNLGSATATKRGIDIQTTTGSCSIQNCSFHDFAVASSLGINITTTTGSITFSNNIVYNINTSGITLAATNGAHTITGNLFIKNTNGSILDSSDAGSNISNNVFVGSVGTPQIVEGGIIGTFTGNVFHSSSSVGLLFQSIAGGTIGANTIYRNSNTGFNLLACKGTINIGAITAFGNNGSNICLWAGGGSSANLGVFIFTGCILNAGITLTTSLGVQINNPSSIVIFENCSFGATTSHTTADISQGSNWFQIILRNCLLSSSTEFTGQSSLTSGAYVNSQKNDQSVGNHKWWMQYGTGTIDTAIYDTASPSLRLTPINASNKFDSSPQSFRVAISNGTTCQVFTKVRESVLGDGTAYNGNHARLILKKNVALGIASDTVLATATSAAAGAFQLLTGTSPIVTDDGILEFVVDCDGTTGWINIDSWQTNVFNDTKGSKYWLDGQPLIVGNNNNIFLSNFTGGMRG